MTRSAFSGAYQRLRELLVEARRSRSLTQAQLADKVGRPQSFVSKYERGERRIDLVELIELADVLGADPHEWIDHVRAAPRLKPKS